MEHITSELKISELKQGSLSKAYEELHSQASSILVFSLQWKDLDTHFGSIRKLIQTELEQLMNREKDVIFREKELKAKWSELKSLIQEYRKKQDAISKSIGEKERDFDRIESCVKEGKEELEVLEKRVKQKSEEAESKGKELESIRKRLKGYKDDIQLKSRKLNAIRRSLEEHKKEIELREEQLRVCTGSIDVCDKEIKEKQEKLDLIRNSIAECSNELESKEQRLDLLRKEVELKEKNLVCLNKIVDQCVEKSEIKEREFEGFLEKLELKEKFCESKFEELGSFGKRVNDSLKEVESREKKLNSLQKSVDERSGELEKKEIEFEKRVNEFKMRERKFDLSKKSTELRAKEKEKTNIIHSRVKVEQLEDTPINNAIGPLTAINQYSIPKEGKELQLLLNRHLKRHDLLCVDISSVLKASLDPAKLVLDAMQGFYPSKSSTEEGTETFDVNIVRRSCILLLEQLMEASTQINSQVREEALKLALDWKAKIIVADGNYLEVLGFLQFLATYRLAPAFDPNELRSLIDTVGQHKQASELRRFLCPPVNAPVKIEQAENSLDNVVTSSSNVQFSISTLQNKVLALLLKSSDPAKFILDYIQGSISEHWKRGDAGFEASVMRNYISVFEQLFRTLPQIKPLVKDDAMKLAVEWKAKMSPNNTDYSLEILGFLQFLATYGLVSSFSEDEILKFLEKISQHKEAVDLCCTLGFAKKIPEFIQNLIQRKEIIDAVRFIFAFKLTDKFSPVPLLTEYMEDLKNSTQISCQGNKPIEEKEKAADKEIAALRAVIQSINVYNLESEFPSANISKRIKLLEQIKDRRCSSGLVRSKFDQQQKQQSIHKAVQQQQKPSDEQKHQKPSVRPNAEQQQEKPSVPSNAEQQQGKPSVQPKAEYQHQQSWKKRRNDRIANHHSPPQGNHKFPRTSASTFRPRGSPGFFPMIPQPSEFPHRLHGHAMGFAGDSGDPRQFSFVAANGHTDSPNFGAGPNAGMPY